MCFQGLRGSLLVPAVPKQWLDSALVVDLDGLLGGRGMVARRGRLQDEAIDGGKDKQLANEARHVVLRAALLNSAAEHGEKAILFTSAASEETFHGHDVGHADAS